MGKKRKDGPSRDVTGKRLHKGQSPSCPYNRKQEAKQKLNTFSEKHLKTEKEGSGLDNSESDSEEYISLFNKKCKNTLGKTDLKMTEGKFSSNDESESDGPLSDATSESDLDDASESESDGEDVGKDIRDHAKIHEGKINKQKLLRQNVTSSSDDEENNMLGEGQSRGSGQHVQGSSNLEPNESDDSETSDGDQETTTEDKFASLRKELEDMPFEDVQKLQEKVGMKVYNQVFGSVAGYGSKEGKKSFKRANKNRPREISSKRRVSAFREVVPVHKRVVRDPRFDDLSGRFDETIFKNSYSFLSDVKQSEKQKLLKKLKKEADDEKKKQLRYLIQRMSNQERAEKIKEARKERARQVKHQEQEMVMSGKAPFYLKKSEQRKLELAEKYRELQKSGKVDKYLGKKRKKNAAKDRRRLPFNLNK